MQKVCIAGFAAVGAWSGRRQYAMSCVLQKEQQGFRDRKQYLLLDEVSSCLTKPQSKNAVFVPYVESGIGLQCYRCHKQKNRIIVK